MENIKLGLPIISECVFLYDCIFSLKSISKSTTIYTRDIYIYIVCFKSIYYVSSGSMLETSLSKLANMFFELKQAILHVNTTEHTQKGMTIISI